MLKNNAQQAIGLTWIIEVAPMLQYGVNASAGVNINNESNFIVWWDLINRQKSNIGSLLLWYQVSATWSGKTTTEFMEDLGVLSPLNGGDTHPKKRANRVQTLAWNQSLFANKFRILLGQLTTRVMLNLNRFAISDREDFFSPLIVNNPVVHYTARLGLGAYLEYKADHWYLSGMIRDANAQKAFLDFDHLFDGINEYVVETAFTPSNLFNLGQGNYRFTYSYTDRVPVSENRIYSGRQYFLH